MYIFKDNFSKSEQEQLKKLIDLYKEELDENGGCSFTGDVEAYIEKKEDAFYISKKNIFIKQ